MLDEAEDHLARAERRVVADDGVQELFGELRRNAGYEAFRQCLTEADALLAQLPGATAAVAARTRPTGGGLAGAAREGFRGHDSAVEHRRRVVWARQADLLRSEESLGRREHALIAERDALLLRRPGP